MLLNGIIVDGQYLIDMDIVGQIALYCAVYMTMMI